MVFNVLWLPVILSAVLFMPFGAFFYSYKGMGTQWLQAIGKTKEELEAENSNMFHLMGSTLFLAVATTFLVAVLVASIGITTIADLALLILVVYLIVFIIRLKNAQFDDNFALFKVNLIGTLGEFVITFAVFAFFV